MSDLWFVLRNDPLVWSVGLFLLAVLAGVLWGYE